MTKTKVMIAVGLLAVSVGALAHGHGERREQMRAQAEERFAAADVDRNGKLDRVEAKALAERVAEHFDRIDRDKDGYLAKEELRAAHRHARAGRHPRIAFMRGMFKGMDDDGDGALTQAEIGSKAPRLSENFASIDSNRDGKLTPEEMRAAHRARHSGGG